MTRTVRRLLVDLGYRCHTPAEIFGTREASLGVADTEWLSKVTNTGWIVLNRDAKIMERPEELAAYRAAKVHMFYLPGEATRDRLRQLVEDHLRDMLIHASAKAPDVWRVSGHGIERFPIPSRKRRGHEQN